MKIFSLDECIARAMDCENIEILPFLPYILQDFFEIGSSAESILEIVKTNTSDYNNLKILDLGCGKGAVSIKLAESINSNCLGIDAIPEFIEFANKTASDKNLKNCKFICGDLRIEINHFGKYDVIILASIGPVFGNYYETMKILKNNLSQDGVIVLDDGYMADENIFHHESVSTKSQLITEIDRAEMKILNEYIENEINNSIEYEKQLKDIVNRCRELKKAYPEKSKLFEVYLYTQKQEYVNLENHIICSTMVVSRK